MIGSQKNAAIRHMITSPVRELVLRLAGQKSSPLEVIQVSLKSNAPECHDHAEVRESLQLAVEKGSATFNFLGQGLVGGWCAANGRGDVRVPQLKPIATMGRRRLGGESGAMQHWIKKASRGVAGEGTSGAVRAMRSGRKPQDEHTRIRITKSRDRPSPVFPILIGAALFFSNFLTVLHQPRTARAGNHFTVQTGEPS